MRLALQNWIFDVDVNKTASIYEKGVLDHCTCGYCRNFYEAVDVAYPDLRQFLNEFGVNLEAPEELLPVEPTLCVVSYCVCGTVIQRGNPLRDLEHCTITIQSQEEKDYDDDWPTPFFVLTTGVLELPWLLDEPMEDVVSPANEPECMERMGQKLLNGADCEMVQS